MSAFDYDALEAAGIETLVVNYSGQNDEGYVEEMEPTPDVDLDYGGELYDLIQQQAYDVLEQHCGGWEINEGSSGHITINVKERTALLHHGETRHVQDWTDTVLS